MERRQFIRKGCETCLGMAGLGLLLSSCGSTLPLFKTTTGDNNMMRVPISRFGQNSDLLLVRNSKISGDILLIREGNDFKALLMMCTHEGIGLTATAKKIYCTAHGSEFDMGGKVVKGPALRPLSHFATEVKNNEVLIHLI